jgi:filamentous hemagglutinin family protein
MSNISSFTIEQYGALVVNSTMLLNMDRFIDVQDYPTNKTFVKYDTGQSSPEGIIINETFSAVTAKIETKTPPASADLYVISINGIVFNQTFSLNTGYILSAQAQGASGNSIIQYKSSTGPIEKYIIQGGLSTITSGIIERVVIPHTAAITTTPEVITLPYDFGAAGNYVASVTIASGGAVVNSVTNVNGTQISVETSSQPCDVIIIAVSI